MTYDIKLIASSEYNNDIELVRRKLKNIASRKTRLKDLRLSEEEYCKRLDAIVLDETKLKNARDYLSNKPKAARCLSEADIESLTYVQTVNALNTVRTTKSRHYWSELSKRSADGYFIPGTSPIYTDACKTEQLLLKHKKAVDPNLHGTIKKSDLQHLVDNLRSEPNLDVATCITKIEELLHNFP